MKQVKIKIHVSAGELADKISILEIKSRKIKDESKLKLVKAELKLLKKELSKLRAKNGKLPAGLGKLASALYRANLKLWNIENILRDREGKKDFGRKFIANARKVYLTNDRRCEIKNEINKLLGSAIAEVKEYKKYK